ncbi:hypothetical protein PENTCL1PPCAC_8999, partial [Pristionchus entomophagus]
ALVRQFPVVIILFQAFETIPCSDPIIPGSSMKLALILIGGGKDELVAAALEAALSKLSPGHSKIVEETLKSTEEVKEEKAEEKKDEKRVRRMVLTKWPGSNVMSE